MITALLLLMTTAVTLCSAMRGLLPDINLHGTKLDDVNGTIIHFNCSTSHKTLGCSIEFHVNDVTYDNLRFVDDECVHNKGICLYNTCCCNKNCKIFSLNMSTTSYNSTFGCEARIFVIDTKTTYSVRTAVKQNGEDFKLFEKVIIPVKVGETSASLTLDTLTLKNPIFIITGFLSTYMSKIQMVTSIVSVILFVLVVVMCGCICREVIRKKRTKGLFKKDKFEQEKGVSLSSIGHGKVCSNMEIRSTSEVRLTIIKKDQGRAISPISTISGSSTERSTSPLTRDENSPSPR